VGQCQSVVGNTGAPFGDNEPVMAQHGEVLSEVGAFEPHSGEHFRHRCFVVGRHDFDDANAVRCSSPLRGLP